MPDIIPISEADRLDFIEGLRSVSTWSHSVNQHNGFWEELELLRSLANSAGGPDLRVKMVREIVLGRIALIHSEQSEAVEAVRKQDPATWSSTEKDSFVSEMAGTVVRIMDLCEWLGVPLAEAIVAEVQRNEKRGYRHGGKAA
jgi:hypothetical protein